MLYVEYADTTSLVTNQHQGHGHNLPHSYGQQAHNYEQQHGQEYGQMAGYRPPHFPSEPTDTMIVRNLDLNSTEETIRTAFDYITKKAILDIRLAKDRMVSLIKIF